MEAGFDRKKYGAVLRGEYGEVRLANVQRPDGYILVKDGIEKTVEIPYENDFLCEISHFTELLKAGKKESDLMPFADSVRIAAVSDAAMEASLKMNGVADGKKSYGRMVDLLLNYGIGR